MATPDLHSSPIWIFDLDNTLHDASPHVFPHINRAMTDYVAQHLGLGEDEASALRQRYWLLYGATLPGLMRHHGTDPHHFLRHTHQLPEPRRMIVFDRGLRAMLKRLPGRKIVFSNGPQRYAELVLDILGVRRCFDAMFAIEQARFRPKPGVHGFLRLLQAQRLNPRRCVMVEDSLENLHTAKRLGMRTVWISRSPRTAAFVDLRLKSVLELPRKLARLRGL
ncbi:MAG: pyrimidine 5'-nucleotidase [Pseudomonadota bacterium]